MRFQVPKDNVPFLCQVNTKGFRIKLDLTSCQTMSVKGTTRPSWKQKAVKRSTAFILVAEFILMALEKILVLHSKKH